MYCMIETLVTFGNLRKIFGNLCRALGMILESLQMFRKWKSSENHQKRRYQYVYIRKRILHAPLWIWILSSQVEHSKIKFMSTSKHVSKHVSSIYFVFWRYMLTMYCYWPYKRYLATELSLNVCIERRSLQKHIVFVNAIWKPCTLMLATHRSFSL